MQQTGTLRKRRKRNLTKVPGLGIIPYDASTDVLENFYTFKTEDNHNSGRQSEKTRFFAETNSNISHRAFDFHKSRDSLARDEEDGLEFDDKNGPGPPTNSKQVDDQTYPYVLSRKAVKRMSYFILLGASSFVFPWKWNWKTYTLEEWSPKYKILWRIGWTLYTIQLSFLMVYQIYIFVESIRDAREKKSYRNVFQTSLSFFLYCHATYFNLNNYFHRDVMRQYVNSMFALNKKYVEKYVKTMDGYQEGGRLFIDVYTFMSLSQVFNMMAIFFLMPYAPWFVFHYVYTPELSWWYRVPGTMQQYILIGQVITCFGIICWVSFAHTTTVKFWLQEIHNNNPTMMTTNAIRKQYNAVQVFQSLEVLCTLFNDCMSPMAIPSIKFHIACSFITCCYVLINSMSSVFLDEFPGILLYPIGVFNTSVGGMTVLANSAEMFDLSVSFVDSWSRTRHKDFRRLLKSFPTLKVRVGRWYFITVSTTITFFKVMVDYVIDCIITF